MLLKYTKTNHLNSNNYIIYNPTIILNPKTMENGSGTIVYNNSDNLFRNYNFFISLNQSRLKV